MPDKIKIGNKWVNESGPVFIIAEVGSNYDKKLSQAKELIDAVAQGGADAVKFQLFKAKSFYPESDPMFQVMKKNEFPREWLEELSGYARKRGVLFLASPFDREAVDLLKKIGSPVLKFASSETTNLPLLRYAASKGLPLLVSTGMCNLADIYEAIEVIYSKGNKEIVLLHCAALYPPAPEDINLRAMDTLKNAFNVLVGYSDHSLGITMAIAAVARGASVIEKHITLSRKLKGPDHAYAIEPDELKAMVKAIRDTERALGSPTKKMLNAEKKFARRNSLIAQHDIAKGTMINQEMIAVKRPALGIEPRFLSAVLGQKTSKTIKAGEAVNWQDLS